MSKTTAELLVDLKRAKAVRDEADEMVTAITEDLVAAMKKEGTTTLKCRDDKDAITGTLVEATRVLIDEDRLKKNLGARMWDRVTKKVLDKPKLEDAIARGDVDPNVVAQCSEVKANRPYVKVTTKALPTAVAGRKVRKVVR